MNIDEKYPDPRFEHWLNLYRLNREGWDEQSVEHHIDMYKDIEGRAVYESVKDELKIIIKAGDLEEFLSYFNHRYELTITIDELGQMIECMLPPRYHLD